MADSLARLIFIDDTAAGKRLDQWLAEKCAPELSRSRVAKLIRGGYVSIGGQVAAEPRLKPPLGQELRLILPPAEEAKPQPQAIALDILYEDADIIIVNKPAGLVVHPGNGNADGTLVNALLHHCASGAQGSLSGIGGVKRPGIVHRLDKDTSGVLAVAKNDAAHAALSCQFADHGRTCALERRYLALIWGAPAPEAGVIALPLARAKYDRTRRMVAREGSRDARHAVTHYKIMQIFGAAAESSPAAALAECRLETGRTHQIRVHMAHIGHPLIGDKTYGQAFKTKANRLKPAARQAAAAFPRQALHAAYLRIEHPKTGAVMEFSAPLPADMAELRRVLAL